MENLLKELAWKCYQNGLNFEHIPLGDDDVNRVTLFINDELIHISECRTKGWVLDHKDPVKELERMHKEVDEFLEERENE